MVPGFGITIENKSGVDIVMKYTNTVKRILFLPLLTAFSFQAQSALIGFSPSSSSVDLNETFDVDLTISGLGGFGPDSFISGFDLDVSFDSSILAYGGFQFGTGLDDVGGFGVNSIQLASNLGGGTVNVFEVSLDFDFDLELLQPDAFSLGTFTFTGIGEGTTALSAAEPFFGTALAGGFIFDQALQTFVASEVPMQVRAGKVSVPEPGIALLLVTGLLGFGVHRKYCARRA